MARDLEDRLHDLFAEPLDDEELLARLDALAEDIAFARLVAVWGPPLYRRNRARFRPFIANHFPDPWNLARWGAYREALEQWLAEADRLDDDHLFHLLLRWKIQSLWRRQRGYQELLLRRFRAAGDAAQRRRVLEKFDVGYTIDEATALGLYLADPAVTRSFILPRLEPGWAPRLLEAARRQGDEDLASSLYRRGVPAKRWLEDLHRLCREVADPEQLCAELERHHPWHLPNHWGSGLVLVLELRGEDVFPYVMRHLGRSWGLWGWTRRLRQLARQRHWPEMLAALNYYRGDAADYESAMRALLADERTTEERFGVLAAGVAHWPARPLPDAVAVLAYRRFPALLRGKLRNWVGWPALAEPSPLLETLLQAGDEELLDHLAAQAMVSSDHPQNVERLALHYEELLAKDPAAFARRAGRIFAQLSTPDPRRLSRGNRLARLLLDQAVRLDLAPLRTLLESPAAGVQALALHALAADNDSARAAAAEHLDLLLPLLLLPLPKAARAVLMGALLNAATTEERGRVVLGRARDALDLPEKECPREPLIGLIGRLLARWPALRQPRERPVVHGGREG